MQGEWSPVVVTKPSKFRYNLNMTIEHSSSDHLPDIRQFKTSKRRFHRNAIPGRVALLVLVTLGMTAVSCSKTLGWGVVLWPPEASPLEYGQSVQVLFKSNITRTYAVKVPNSDNNAELELWRLDMHGKRKAAEAAASSYAEIAPVFGVAARDGLLLRERPQNTASQVYRMRLGQAIKLLQKVKGAVVETGGTPLPGDWYLALAEDGTRGYIFSNQLVLWNARTEKRPDMTVHAPRQDIRIAEMFNSIWRPDYFIPMADSGQVDLRTYSARFGLFANAIDRMVRVERPGFSRVYRYTSIAERPDGTFELVPTGAVVHYNQAGDLVLTPPVADLTAALRATRNPDDPEAPITVVFSKQRDDPQAVMATEERRRLARLATLVADGERFESDMHGVLILTRSARFTWVSYDALVPNIIPEGTLGVGAILMDTFLDPEMALYWDGALSLLFDGEKRPRVTFAYRFSQYNLELAHIRPEFINGATVVPSVEFLPDAVFTRYR
jgi:hypothetical protein